MLRQLVCSGSMMKKALPKDRLLLPGVFIAFATLLLATPAHAHFTMTFNGMTGQPTSWQEGAGRALRRRRLLQRVGQPQMRREGGRGTEDAARARRRRLRGGT